MLKSNSRDIHTQNVTQFLSRSQVSINVLPHSSLAVYKKAYYYFALDRPSFNSEAKLMIYHPKQMFYQDYHKLLIDIYMTTHFILLLTQS